jgi:pyruvate,water dikinase
VETIITGIGASNGRIEGRARVVPERRTVARLEPGDVLVTVMTDPLAFVDIIERAAAVVTDEGGMASHPAILCRELGIPCVVGATGATSTIPDGAMVEVDGTAGTIVVQD